ncbi:hypothetical protein [Candidatus Uabimicrobium sp. HlEnr_7]|uniref:hypothetical protein n=1 Tax=Candidatus Uabimicrobium helgolandensis TaxID=3095367 RepID=UPI0035584864
MKYVFFISIIACSCLFAENSLKQNHENTLLYYGDVEFLQGQHQNFTQMDVVNNNDKNSSIFLLANSFAYYCASEKNTTYIICKAVKQKDSLNLTFTNRLLRDKYSQTIKYTTIFDLSDNFNIRTFVDKEITDARADFLHIISCVLQFAPEFLPIITKCKGDILKCILEIVSPASKLFKCIFKKDSQIQKQRVGRFTEIPFQFLPPFTSEYTIYKLNRQKIANYTVEITSKSPNIVDFEIDVKIVNNVLRVGIKNITYTGNGRLYINGKVILFSEK